MVYYFKETQKLGLTSTFEYGVTDEKGMRKEWAAKFWTIDDFYVDEKGNYFYHHQGPLYYRTKQTAICQLIKNNNVENHERLLVLHTIDQYRFHWLDFYQVIKLDNGEYKTQKLKKKQAYIEKNKRVVDENGKIVSENFELLQ